MSDRLKRHTVNHKMVFEWKEKAFCYIFINFSKEISEYREILHLHIFVCLLDLLREAAKKVFF